MKLIDCLNPGIKAVFGKEVNVKAGTVKPKILDHGEYIAAWLPPVEEQDAVAILSGLRDVHSHYMLKFNGEIKELEPDGIIFRLNKAFKEGGFQEEHFQAAKK